MIVRAGEGESRESTRRENRTVENSLLSGARIPLFYRSRRARRLSVSLHERHRRAERDRHVLRYCPSTIGRLMDCDTKWRQSVSSFSCLYRRNLRRAYCSLHRSTGKTNCNWDTTMHNGTQSKQASKRSECLFPFSRNRKSPMRCTKSC